MKQLINKITTGIANLAREAGVCFNNDYASCKDRCENPENCSAYKKYLSEQRLLQDVLEYNKMGEIE